MRGARFALAALLCVAMLGAARPTPTPEPSPPPFTELPTPEPEATETVAASFGSPDPVAERYYRLARDAWRASDNVPFVHYGALVRYEHNHHVFDNWWDAYYRPSDGAFGLERLTDPDEDKRRLGGVPFSIFGVTIFDTNKDSEPISLSEPRIEPTYAFGIVPEPSPLPSGGLAPEPTALPSPGDSGLKQIAVVASANRSYEIRYVGTSRIGDVDALHLTFTPLRDPSTYRLRELWIDPTTYRTMQLRVQGILNGEPYDKVSWIAHYVELDGHNYLQQIVADAPLHFGFGTTIRKLEFDFFDYHFPKTVPPLTFGSKIF